MDPPPSLPVAIGSRPPATAAAVPPDDPPGVRSRFHGLRVVPCNSVEVQLMPPNSGAAVWAASTAPVARRRDSDVSSWSATRSRKMHGGLRVRPPLHLLELLDAEGHAAEGQRDVGLAGCLASARSKSVKLKALSGDASMAAMHSSSASSGDSSPARKASTRPQASPSHGVLTARTSTPAPPRRAPAAARSVACRG